MSIFHVPGVGTMTPQQYDRFAETGMTPSQYDRAREAAGEFKALALSAGLDRDDARDLWSDAVDLAHGEPIPSHLKAHASLSRPRAFRAACKALGLADARDHREMWELACEACGVEPTAKADTLPSAARHASGGEAKPAGGGRSLEGWAVRFGSSCDAADVQGDLFSASGDYGLDDVKAVRVLWHHDGRRGRIGTATLARKSDGIWATIALSPDLDRAEADRLARLAREGRLFLSSGSASHLAVRDRKADRCNLITTWPIVEISLTERPVDRSCTVRPATKADLDPIDAFIAEAEEWMFDHEFKALEQWNKRQEAEERRRLDRALAEFQAFIDRNSRCSCGCGEPDGGCSIPGVKALSSALASGRRKAEELVPIGRALAVRGLALVLGTRHVDGETFDREADLGLAPGDMLIVPLTVDHDATKSLVGLARLTRGLAGIEADCLVDLTAEAAGPFNRWVGAWGWKFSTVGDDIRREGARITSWRPIEACLTESPADPSAKVFNSRFVDTGDDPAAALDTLRTRGVSAFRTIYPFLPF